jgi:hypothetical protein
MLPCRQFFENVHDKLEPALVHLHISEHVLGTFDYVILTKFVVTSFETRPEAAGVRCDVVYYIGFGLFSLAYRHFPESNSSTGVLLVQTHREMAVKLTEDLQDYQDLIGLPILPPFAAQRAIDGVLSSWLDLQRKL